MKRDTSNDFSHSKFYPVSNKEHLGAALNPVADRH